MMTRGFQFQTFGMAWIACCAVCWLSNGVFCPLAAASPAQAPASTVAEADEAGPVTAAPANELQFVSAGAIGESDTFDVDLSQSDLAGAADRAWEYRPYRVAVWLCIDGSPELAAVNESLKQRLAELAELVDPSGWNLAIDAAPRRWRWQFLRHLESPECCAGFQDEPVLADYDKLMVVTLACDGRTTANVREYDMLTGQWGALGTRHLGQRTHLASQVIDLVRSAFMPLAQIDRVTEREGARLIARALKTCVEVGRTSSGALEARPNEGSPVFIRDTDRFMPVIRRTDRKGQLLKLEPIEFTYLTVNNLDESIVTCDIHSSQRAPLAQRKSKRAQKLALVIRAPQRSTMLQLVSKDQRAEPMPGVEIWSRRIDMTRKDKSEYIGKTDWLGSIEIPPDDKELRLIFIKRGSRALKKLPIIPGLHEKVVATVPNDKVRLFAQGVITGFNNEIMALAIQRNVFEAEIDAALKKKDTETAKRVLRDYQELDSPQDIRSRMSDENIRLETLTRDKRELDHIRRMFGNLNEVLGDQMKRSRESELLNRVQQMSDAR